MTKICNERGVIFDLDGVIIDTGPFHKQSWYDLAEREGYRMSDELFYSTFGMQNYHIIPKLAERQVTKDEIDRMSDWKEQRYRDLIKGKLQLLEGVKALIDNLKKNGFLLAIGTSAPRANLEFMLEHIPLADCFDAFVTGEDVTSGKPAPDTFLKAAEKLSIQPGRCIVVEDAVVGIQAAKSAGMAVVAVTNTTEADKLSQADLVVDSLAELAAKDFVALIE
jgi:beta-phosphoglucomutase family hydrolase